MSCSLNKLLAAVNLGPISADVQISNISIDSRTISSGDLFIAYAGSSQDGRNYILQAQQQGAVAILYESDDYDLPDEVTIPAIAVDGLQHKAGIIADCFFGSPSQSMQVLGITGTNGKTTCCYLLAQALNSLGLRVAMIGTIGVGEINSENDINDLQTASHTTPDAISVHRLLSELQKQGVTHICMEVSSHALDQGRVVGVKFFACLFTNLSHDHLDYHGDLQQYADAKKRLFTEFESELVITNADDDLGGQLIDIANSEFIASYGDSGDVTAEEVQLDASGIKLVIVGSGLDFDLQTPLLGMVNVPNVLLVVAALLSLSVDIEQIQNAFKSIKAAPGRMEAFSGANRPAAVVDYAHTPDALERALLSVKKHCSGKLWCVFGCGGDRDKEKRPLMGTIAQQLADQIVITDDNPRSESPEQIVGDILSDIEMDNHIHVIHDRAIAIEWALDKAQTQDWVLIAGKGHEQTQHYADKTIEFSDRHWVRSCMEVAA